MSAIDLPYRRNTLQPDRNKRNGTFARIRWTVGTSIYPLERANLMIGRTGVLNDVIQFPKPTQSATMSILSSKDCIVGGHDIPSFALVEKIQTHLRHRIVRPRYPNHADGDGIFHVPPLMEEWRRLRLASGSGR